MSLKDKAKEIHIDKPKDVESIKDHLRSDEFKESGWKLFIGSMIVPMISAFSLFLAAWYTSNIVDWSIFIITINVISLPALRAWLVKQFKIEKSAYVDAVSDIEGIYERRITTLKQDQMDAMETIKDENNALKIKVELQKYQIEHP